MISNLLVLSVLLMGCDPGAPLDKLGKSIPAQTPTLKPSLETKNPRLPSAEPTNLEPSKQPTRPPTKQPTNAPPIRKGPSSLPTGSPSGAPNENPTPSPTKPPTKAPTKYPPTKPPTLEPTPLPTKETTGKPTINPTTKPPTQKPTPPPTKAPTTKPPTRKPTKRPTPKPTKHPTHKPTTPKPTPRPTPPPPTPKPTADLISFLNEAVTLLNGLLQNLHEEIDIPNQIKIDAELIGEYNKDVGGVRGCRTNIADYEARLKTCSGADSLRIGLVELVRSEKLDANSVKFTVSGSASMQALQCEADFWGRLNRICNIKNKHWKKVGADASASITNMRITLDATLRVTEKGICFTINDISLPVPGYRFNGLKVSIELIGRLGFKVGVPGYILNALANEFDLDDELDKLMTDLEEKMTKELGEYCL